MSQNRTCSKCHRARPQQHFLGKSGRTTLTCDACRGVVVAEHVPESDSESESEASSEEDESDSESEEDEPFHMNCQHCNKSFTDISSAQRHVLSAAHRKNWNK